MNEKKILISFNLAILASIILSILTRQNIIILFFCIILMLIISILLILKPKVLMLLTILISLFSNKLSDFAGFMQILPVYLYCLMIIYLILKKDKLKINKILFIYTIVSSIFSILPYIYTEFKLLAFVIGMIKRFSFVIITTFVMNLDMNMENLKNFIFKLIIYVMISNTIVAGIQFLLGSRSDDVVGFLGKNMTGTIGYLLMYFLILTISYDYRMKNKGIYLILSIGIVFIYAAIAEVKILFVVATLLVCLYILIRKNKIKSIFMAIVICIGVISSYSYFINIYPHHNFLQKGFLNEYLHEQSYGDGTVNRFSFISDLNNSVLTTEYDRLLGKGIGSGNPSRIKLLQGKINENYGYLKYYWFTTSYVYIETGFIGIVGLILVQVYLFIKLSRLFYIKRSEDELFLLFATVLNTIFIIYSSAFMDYCISTIYWTLIGIYICQNYKYINSEEVAR